FSRVLARVAHRLLGAHAHARSDVARAQKPRCAGQGLHHAERDLRDLRLRTARAGRRAVAHADAALACARSCRSGVHRQHRLCSHGAHHPHRHGGHVRAVRSSAIRVEGRARRRIDRRRADRRGVGILAISAPTRVSCRGGAADLRRRRRQHPDRAADRVLEKSLAFIAEAPLIGHGTGTIPALFRRDVTAETNPALITTNPHSQILAVMIELGLVGAVALVAMWLAHLALFRDGTLIAWFGLLVVTYNVVSSLFNSHLFDFGEGWLYVFGVGLTGGMMLRAADAQ